MQTVAVRKGDHHRIRGQKRYITPVASFVVLLAKTDDRISEIAVDLDRPGEGSASPT